MEIVVGDKVGVEKGLGWGSACLPLPLHLSSLPSNSKLLSLFLRVFAAAKAGAVCTGHGQHGRRLQLLRSCLGHLAVRLQAIFLIHATVIEFACPIKKHTSNVNSLYIPWGLTFGGGGGQHCHAWGWAGERGEGSGGKERTAVVTANEVVGRVVDPAHIPPGKYPTHSFQSLLVISQILTG